MRTQVCCKPQRPTAWWGRSPAVKPRGFYSRCERSLAVKLQLQAFAALYSWVGTQLGCKTAAASFCSALQLGGDAVKRCFTAGGSAPPLGEDAAPHRWVGTQLGTGGKRSGQGGKAPGLGFCESAKLAM